MHENKMLQMSIKWIFWNVFVTDHGNSIQAARMLNSIGKKIRIIDCICEVFIHANWNIFRNRFHKFVHTSHRTVYPCARLCALSFQHCRQPDSSTHAAVEQFTVNIYALSLHCISIGFRYFEFAFFVSTKYLHFSAMKYPNKRIFQYLLPNAAGESFVWQMTFVIWVFKLTVRFAPNQMNANLYLNEHKYRFYLT